MNSDLCYWNFSKGTFEVLEVPEPVFTAQIHARGTTMVGKVKKCIGVQLDAEDECCLFCHHMKLQYNLR